MNPLPQRRKTPEELAQLREHLGIPPAAPPPFSVTAPAAPVAKHPPPPLSVPAFPPHRERRFPDHHSAHAHGPLSPEHRFHTPPPAAPALHAPPTPAPPPPPPAPSPTPAPSAAPKIVRSLRRSERVPLAPVIPHHRASSPVPVVRHNAQELNELRRHNSIADQSASLWDARVAAAPLWWIIPGYLCAIAGVVFAIPKAQQYFLPYSSSATCFSIVAVWEILALAIATLLFFRRFYSRHHAAILLGIAFFTLIFAFLHLFPQFQHGS